MTTGFLVTTSDEIQIRFRLYWEDAPVTAEAFLTLLPFSRVFYQARISGQETWIDDVPPLDIIQENASVFTQAGEVVFGPMKPTRAKTANCMGIYYGEGRGVDACNIFAKVFEEDTTLLQTLGNQIWRNGCQTLTFSILA